MWTKDGSTAWRQGEKGGVSTANVDEGRKHAQCCTTCREATCREVTQNNDMQRQHHLDDVACRLHHMLAKMAGIWGL